jgi:ATP-dependent Clp protease ATP-binding subunit ClpA
VYLSDAIIIMTSNVGSEHFRKLTNPVGFLAREAGIGQVRADIRRELERRFPPEFLNRIDEIVLFDPLTPDDVRTIAQQYLANLTATLTKAGKTLRVDDDALAWIVTHGYNLSFGARFLKRAIDERVKLPISARWHESAHFHVRVRDGELIVDLSPAHLVTDDNGLACAV